MEDPANAATTAFEAPKLRPSVENRGIEEYIAAGIRTVEAARLNTDIAEKLYPYGFDDEEMSIGLGMAEVARTALASHQEAIHATKAAEAEHELKAAMAAAREKFDTFRGVARAAFSGLSERLNLKVVGEPPDDLQRFVNAAHAAYMTGSAEPFADKLTKRGYPPEKLGKLCEEIDALAEIGEDQAEAAEESEKTDSTAHRDDTYNAFKEFMKEFKGVALTVFRDEPDQLKKLGLRGVPEIV